MTSAAATLTSKVLTSIDICSFWRDKLLASCDDFLPSMRHISLCPPALCIQGPRRECAALTGPRSVALCSAQAAARCSSSATCCALPRTALRAAAAACRRHAALVDVTRGTGQRRRPGDGAALIAARICPGVSQCWTAPEPGAIRVSEEAPSSQDRL